MAEPFKHPKTGVYYARKVIPERLRAALGKREFRQSLHTKDQKVAKLRQLDALAKFEALVAQAEAGPATLSHLQVVALAGEWYRRELAEWKDDPVSSAEEWAIALDPLQEAEERGQSVEAVAGEVDALLAAEGLIVDSASRHKLAERVFWLKVRLFNRLGKQADGDYSPDPILKTVPTWERPKAPEVTPQAGAVTFAGILAGWEHEAKPKPKTFAEWKRTLERFAAFVGHDDPVRVVRADVIRWKEQLLTTKLAPRSVKAHLDAVRTLLGWAEENGRIITNPARKVSLKIKRDGATARRKYTEEEAAMILSAARMQKHQSRRWVPWVLAYTGARVEEVCGAEAKDIKTTDGIPHLDLTGRDLKTEGSNRLIPLHPALVAEGFLNYAAGLPKDSPLFPDLKVVRFGKRGVEWSKWYGRWLDSLGITDRRVVAHSWRHRFKDWCRDADISKETHDKLTGHGASDEGGKYGEGGSLETLSRAVRKLPAIKL